MVAEDDRTWLNRIGLAHIGARQLQDGFMGAVFGRKNRVLPAISFVAALLLLTVACGDNLSGPSLPSGQQVGAAPSAEAEQPPSTPTPVPATPGAVAAVGSESKSNTPPATATGAESNTPPATATGAESKPDASPAQATGADAKSDTPPAPTATAVSKSDTSSTVAATETATPTGTPVPAPAAVSETPAPTSLPILVNTPGPVAMLAPDFTLPSIQGPEYTLAEYRGKKPVLVVFYRAYW